jgi:predicted RNA-binding protein YlqC (UPF0109 family)
MKEGADQEFLEFLIKNLVDHPDDVRVERKVDERGVLLTLHVNPMDMGQVVGRQGSTAKAVRMLLRIVGVKGGSRVNLKIEEPEGGMYRRAETASEPTPAPATEAPASDTPPAEGSV